MYTAYYSDIIRNILHKKGNIMISVEILKNIIINQKERIKGNYIPREYLSKIERFKNLKHIIVITGHRRAGKSIFLYEIINKFYSKDEIFYINFEDERLIGFNSNDFEQLMETFIRLWGDKKTVFFDEIQNVENWELFINRLYEDGYKIYITGSNSTLLSSELSTHLTGRHIDLTIYPFSMREMLIYNNISYSDIDLYKNTNRAKILSIFDIYINEGGFPEYIISKEKLILEMLFSDVISKDIIMRYNIDKIRAFKDITRYLVSNFSNHFSYNKIKNIFNIGSVHTVKNYVEYLKSTYMIDILEQFSYSLKNIEQYKKKIYLIDNGLGNAIRFRNTRDIGNLYENCVFIELKRRQKEIYFWKDRNGKEVDFLIKSNNKEIELIQVSYDINDNKTYKRETTALLNGLDEFGIKRGTIISESLDEIRKIKGREIHFVPLWKWLLQEKVK